MLLAALMLLHVFSPFVIRRDVLLSIPVVGVILKNTQVDRKDRLFAG